jgi:hypothetical protein
MMEPLSQILTDPPSYGQPPGPATDGHGAHVHPQPAPPGHPI